MDFIDAIEDLEIEVEKIDRELKEATCLKKDKNLSEQLGYSQLKLKEFKQLGYAQLKLK